MKLQYLLALFVAHIFSSNAFANDAASENGAIKFLGFSVDMDYMQVESQAKKILGNQADCQYDMYFRSLGLGHLQAKDLSKVLENIDRHGGHSSDSLRFICDKIGNPVLHDAIEVVFKKPIDTYEEQISFLSFKCVLYEGCSIDYDDMKDALFKRYGDSGVADKYKEREYQWRKVLTLYGKMGDELEYVDAISLSQSNRAIIQLWRKNFTKSGKKKPKF